MQNLTTRGDNFMQEQHQVPELFAAFTDANRALKRVMRHLVELEEEFGWDGNFYKIAVGNLIRNTNVEWTQDDMGQVVIPSVLCIQHSLWRHTGGESDQAKTLRILEQALKTIK